MPVRGGRESVTEMIKRTTVKKARGGNSDTTIANKITNSNRQLVLLTTIVNASLQQSDEHITELNELYEIENNKSIVQPQKMLDKIKTEIKRYTGLFHTLSENAGEYVQYVQTQKSIKSIIIESLCPITFEKMKPYCILFDDINVSPIDPSINDLKDWSKCIKKTDEDITNAKKKN